MKRLLVTVVVCLATVASLALVPSGAAAATTTMPSPAELDAYLAGKGSPMAGAGAAFVASGGRWQVDPRLVVAIAGAESNFGRVTCAPFNAWGYGCPNGPYEFESWADGIDTVTEGLRRNYLAEGRTSVALINLKYAPVGAANDPTGLNNHWTLNVSKFLLELGGDPADVDMAGIGGTLALGEVTDGSALTGFQFTEAPDPGPPADDADDADLEVRAGDPRALRIRVTNTGSLTWRPQDVRLRRVDDEPRVGGAPYGALEGATQVAPGAEAEFVVDLAAIGSQSGTAVTRWRLEGPGGPFGDELERTVRFAIPSFVAGEAQVEVAPTNGGINPEAAPAWRVLVRVRNAGSEAWRRDGDVGVLLGLAPEDDASTHAQLAGESWINERVVARMLERTAAPGEVATFAFRVRGAAGSFLLRPFSAGGWAAGEPIEVAVG